MTPITADRLIALNACKTQVDVFRKLFPEGAPLTIEAAVSVAEHFDWNWAATKLLSVNGLKAYREAEAPLWKAYREAEASLWKAYREAEAPLWKAYEEAEAPLWKAYEEAEASLLKAYEEARAPLLKAYEEAEAPLWKAYREAEARAFAAAYINDQEKPK
ncbi:MAG: hypothetical protein ACRC6I_01845 [Paracoccaceae bacterium]